MPAFSLGVFWYHTGMRPIKFFDLSRQHKKLVRELLAAFRSVTRGSAFILGKEVSSFESAFAKCFGFPYAVGVNSGSDALYLSLIASGIGKGDEVITSPFTYIASADSISQTGARPVFVDIDPVTLTINPRLLEAVITKRTKAVVVVHLFGYPADMTRIMKIARKHDLIIIEDAAQAVGAKYRGRNIGSFGDLACFSFFPTKNLGALGDGGMIVTGNHDTAVLLRKLRAHGMFKKYHHDVQGINSRLDTLQAAFLGVKLKHFHAWSERRRSLAARYTRALAKVGDLRFPPSAEGYRHVYHQYVLRTGERDALREFLDAHGVGTEVYYPLALHLQPLFKELGYVPGDLPNAERATREVLALPIYPELSNEEQSYIIKIIKRFFKDNP